MALFLLIVPIGCKAQSNKGINIEKLKQNTQLGSISPIDAYFPDSLVMVFNKSAGQNDTSWILAAFRIDSVVLIKVHEFTPKIIAENFSIKPDSIGYINFNGYICRFPLKYWDDLIKETGLNDYKQKNPIPEDKYGGTTYTLYYKSDVLVDSKEDFLFLKKVDSLFTEKIINTIHYRAAHTPSQYDDRKKK